MVKATATAAIMAVSVVMSGVSVVSAGSVGEGFVCSGNSGSIDCAGRYPTLDVGRGRIIWSGDWKRSFWGNGDEYLEPCTYHPSLLILCVSNLDEWG